jgi:hypothetical protein
MNIEITFSNNKDALLLNDAPQGVSLVVPDIVIAKGKRGAAVHEIAKNRFFLALFSAFCPSFTLSQCTFHTDRAPPAKLAGKRKRGITAGKRERPAGTSGVQTAIIGSVVKEHAGLRETG